MFQGRRSAAANIGQNFFGSNQLPYTSVKTCNSMKGEGRLRGRGDQ